MDSIVETQRQTHEELERYEAALAEVLIQNPTVVSLSNVCRPDDTDSLSKETLHDEIERQPTY
jgi:hypothetical protein